MKVVHLNCGNFKKLGLVCHVLLIETNEGLVLIDTGFSSQEDPSGEASFNALTKWYAGPQVGTHQSAYRQIENLGYSPTDVRHILITHLDFDHCGGMVDFPNATVHIFGPEYIAAMAPATVVEKMRHHAPSWKHDPKWQLHKVAGEPWFGFEAVRDIKGLPPEILMIPLTGHTLGHCGVAVQTSNEWLLHAGDAYFHRCQTTHPPQGKMSTKLKLLDRVAQVDTESYTHNLDRLKKLKSAKSEEVKVFCSHDPAELAQFNPTP